MRPALPGQGEERLVYPFRRQRIGTDDEVGDAALEGMNRSFDRGIAGGDADALDPLVGA